MIPHRESVGCRHVRGIVTTSAPRRALRWELADGQTRRRGRPLAFARGTAQSCDDRLQPKGRRFPGSRCPGHNCRQGRRDATASGGQVACLARVQPGLLSRPPSTPANYLTALLHGSLGGDSGQARARTDANAPGACRTMVPSGSGRWIIQRRFRTWSPENRARCRHAVCGRTRARPKCQEDIAWTSPRFHASLTRSASEDLPHPLRVGLVRSRPRRSGGSAFEPTHARARRPRDS